MFHRNIRAYSGRIATCAPMTADSMTFVGFTSTYVLFAGRALRNHRRTRGVSGPQTVMVRGAVAEGASDDPRVEGIRRMNERIASDPRLEATALQTVGRKGWDGFALARVRD